MNNVLLMTLGMKEASKNILFRHGAIIKLLNRDELFNFLLTRSLKTSSNKLFYNSVLKTFYCNAYDFIIKNFDKINCIQIYKDNAIHLWEDNRQFTSLIVFEDHAFCNNELTSSMIKELITFVKNK